MALSKGAKIAILFATIGVTGVAGYLIYNAIKKRRSESLEKEPVIPPSVVVGGDSNSTKATPFTNKAQGDIFRQWVNRFFRSYAEEIDLDVSGDYDNTFMRKAWGKYGETYKKGNPNFLKVKGRNSIPKNLLDAYAKDRDKGFISNSADGDIYLQTSSIGTLASTGKKIYAYFYPNGKVSFNDGTKRVLYVNWGKNGTEIYSGSKIIKGSNYFDTASKTLAWYNNPTAGVGLNVQNYTFNGDANLTQDVDAPSRKGIGVDLNIID
jgi:hypothetical protein